MARINDEISTEIELMKEIAKEYNIEMEPLTIVPVPYKRCLVPCGLGRCNCRATVDKRFAIVFESFKKRCMEDCNREINYFNNELQKVLVKE
jgi:hypothetical protein